MEAVPATRRGRLGSHLHCHHAPADWAIGRAMTAATSAQYPNPANAMRIDTATDTTLARTSIAEVTENCRARFRRARCTTDILLTNMVNEMKAAMCATRGS